MQSAAIRPHAPAAAYSSRHHSCSAIAVGVRSKAGNICGNKTAAPSHPVIARIEPSQPETINRRARKTRRFSQSRFPPDQKIAAITSRTRLASPAATRITWNLHPAIANLLPVSRKRRNRPLHDLFNNRNFNKHRHHQGSNKQHQRRGIQIEDLRIPAIRHQQHRNNRQQCRRHQHRHHRCHVPVHAVDDRQKHLRRKRPHRPAQSNPRPMEHPGHQS